MNLQFAKRSSKRARFLFLLSAPGAIVLHAQTFTTLVNFTGANGAYPGYMNLVQGIDGNLWGTTLSGGDNLGGTVFKMSLGGVLTTTHKFSGSDGSSPAAGLILAANGSYYGTTQYGGANGLGTIFKISPSGKLTTMYSFCPAFDCTTGASPMGGLVQANSGDLYGTTTWGGTSINCANSGVRGCGAVFEITLSGVLTTLHSFNFSDGANPEAALVQGADGNFYGTASLGASSNCSPYGCGSVFRITRGGKLTTLHRFDMADGAVPFAGLVQATDGYFYGTTAGSGSSVGGTVFKIAASGAFTTLYNFNGTDGFWPSTLIQATDGNFYGTTQQGGGPGNGLIFRITPAGQLTTLYSFNSSDGVLPYAGLVQGTDGNFYGSTSQGGTGNQGTVFRLSTGLGPLVKILPASGKVGAAVRILGTELTGATSVTFHGTPASFTIVSPSEITTSVPTGATTGKVKVATPSGMLSSNVPFRVL